jgi:YihY family inner membrane protein
MDVLRPVRAFDRVQQRHRSLAVPIAVLKKFADDGAGGLAALIAYYAFFALFPLLLVFVTVLGYVLHGNPSTLHSVEQSVRENFPVVGSYLKFTELRGSVVALALGLIVSLWSGLGVTNAAQRALNQVWAVPMKERPNFIQARLRGLLLLVSLGAMFVVATAASGLVTGGLGGTWLKVAGIVLSLLINVMLFFASFRLLTSATVETRRLPAGVLLAAVVWTVLQAIGGLYVGHVLKHVSTAYASFGFVIALLVWLHLGAQTTMYAAEVNVVLTRKLWPRSLFGPPTAPADEAALTALAKVEERSDEEQIDVEFRTGDPEARR